MIQYDALSHTQYNKRSFPLSRAHSLPWPKCYTFIIHNCSVLFPESTPARYTLPAKKIAKDHNARTALITNAEDELRNGMRSESAEEYLPPPSGAHDCRTVSRRVSACVPRKARTGRAGTLAAVPRHLSITRDGTDRTLAPFTHAYNLPAL